MTPIRFDHRFYCHLYDDCASYKHDRQKAIQHFLHIGKKDNRITHAEQATLDIMHRHGFDPIQYICRRPSRIGFNHKILFHEWVLNEKRTSLHNPPLNSLAPSSRTVPKQQGKPVRNTTPIKQCIHSHIQKPVKQISIETPSRTLVVARYNENLNWLKTLRDFHGCIHVYDKSNEMNSISTQPDIPSDCSFTRTCIPNVGREGETYLRYIIDHYEALPEQIWFVQGNPLPHAPQLSSFFSHEAYKEYTLEPFKSLTKQYSNSFNTPPQAYVQNNNAYATEHTNGILYTIDAATLLLRGHSSYYDAFHHVKVYKGFETLYGSKNLSHTVCTRVGIQPPQHPFIDWAWSACFYVKKESILKHPKKTYEKLRSFLLDTDGQGGLQGYVLERLWPYIFTGLSYSSLESCYDKHCFLRSNTKYVLVFRYDLSLLKWICIASDSQAIEDPNAYTFFRKSDKSNLIRCLPAIEYTGNVIKEEICHTLHKARRYFHAHVVQCYTS